MPDPLTVKAFQQLIRDRDYKTDAARGAPGTFLWLVEEVGELATAIQKCSTGEDPSPEDRRNLEEEFADVIAWLATLSLGLRLEPMEVVDLTDTARGTGGFGSTGS